MGNAEFNCTSKYKKKRIKIETGVDMLNLRKMYDIFQTPWIHFANIKYQGKA